MCKEMVRQLSKRRSNRSLKNKRRSRSSRRQRRSRSPKLRRRRSSSPVRRYRSSQTDYSCKNWDCFYETWSQEKGYTDIVDEPNVAAQYVRCVHKVTKDIVRFSLFDIAIKRAEQEIDVLDSTAQKKLADALSNVKLPLFVYLNVNHAVNRKPVPVFSLNSKEGNVNFANPNDKSVMSTVPMKNIIQNLKDDIIHSESGEPVKVLHGSVGDTVMLKKVKKQVLMFFGPSGSGKTYSTGDAMQTIWERAADGDEGFLKDEVHNLLSWSFSTMKPKWSKVRKATRRTPRPSARSARPSSRRESARGTESRAVTEYELDTYIEKIKKEKKCMSIHVQIYYGQAWFMKRAEERKASSNPLTDSLVVNNFIEPLSLKSYAHNDWEDKGELHDDNVRRDDKGLGQLEWCLRNGVFISDDRNGKKGYVDRVSEILQTHGQEMKQTPNGEQSLIFQTDKKLNQRFIKQTVNNPQSSRGVTIYTIYYKDKDDGNIRCVILFDAAGNEGAEDLIQSMYEPIVPVSFVSKDDGWNTMRSQIKKEKATKSSGRTIEQPVDEKTEIVEHFGSKEKEQFVRRLIASGTLLDKANGSEAMHYPLSIKPHPILREKQKEKKYEDLAQYMLPIPKCLPERGRIYKTDREYFVVSNAGDVTQVTKEDDIKSIIEYENYAREILAETAFINIMIADMALCIRKVDKDEYSTTSSTQQLMVDSLDQKSTILMLRGQGSTPHDGQQIENVSFPGTLTDKANWKLEYPLFVKQKFVCTRISVTGKKKSLGVDDDVRFVYDYGGMKETLTRWNTVIQNGGSLKPESINTFHDDHRKNKMVQRRYVDLYITHLNDLLKGYQDNTDIAVEDAPSVHAVCVNSSY